MNVLQEIKIPQENVNDEYVTVVEIYFKNGDRVEKGDLLIELETSKTIFTIESEVEGYIEYLCEVEQDVPVGETIIKIYDKPKQEKNEKIINEVKIESTIEKTIFSKKALDYINSNNIDVSLFKNHDFVNLDDILVKLNIKSKPQKTVETEQSYAQKQEQTIDETKVIFEKLSKNKKREIEYLKAVQRENLNSLVNIYVETKGLYKNINPHLKFLKNSLLPVIIFETAKLLKKYPEFNAFFTDDKIAIYNDINIGFAVDMGNGLKTVKIANTISKNIQQIENEIYELSNKYIDNKLTVNDLTDITFTITDLSSEGVSFFTPLINKNNSAILAVSANDEKLNRTILSLAFDHRVTTGKKATIFLKELKERLESYATNRDDEIDTSIRCYKCFRSLKDDYNDVGFVKVVTKNGEEKYICQNCFNGF